MHLYSSCIGSSSRATDYSGYKTSHESMCFSTTCPKCGGGVFFVRHNGGSVWLDPPLRWPWNKHGCFYSEEISSGSYESSLVTHKREKGLNENADLEIGVVKLTWVEPNKNFTDIVLDIGKSEAKEIRVKNNAGFLLGKICVFNRRSEEISPFYEPEYLFTFYNPEKNKYIIPTPIVKALRKPKYEIVAEYKMVKCSVCHCELSKKNLNKHMRKVHKNADNPQQNGR